MRVLVCGSRYFDNLELLHKTLYPIFLDCEEKAEFLTIIEGGAIGADFLARAWAKYNHIKVITYPANWKEHGKAAGPIRNKQMLDEGKPDLVVAFLDPNSRGTSNMIRQATKAGVPVEVIDL